ncbi:unnamed protein product, partial [Ilex paraguariensis]
MFMVRQAPPLPLPGGALSIERCALNSALQFIHQNPQPLLSNRRPPKFQSTNTSRTTKRRCPKPLTVANAKASGGPTAPTRYNPITSNNADDAVSVVGEESVPLEGVIQFEKPNSSNLLNKWGRVALLAGGDVLALLLFSAFGRFSHGFSVFDTETLRTADPFIAGWFLSAYFLGGYGEDGRGMNGQSSAVIAAAKSWSLGIP